MAHIATPTQRLTLPGPHKVSIIIPMTIILREKLKIIFTIKSSSLYGLGRIRLAER